MSLIVQNTSGGRKVWSLARKFVVAALLAVAVVSSSAIVNPAPAEASVAYCGAGRCTLYLSKSETRAMASGNVPAPPASTPWQIRSAYYTLAYSHRWFAQQYANWGYCSGFRLSIYPWESQGYFGYPCNWN
ncbi:hypothetical protein NCCP2145_23720 [Pseudarthrobacter sp. NCCP-2145]|nr:hypothetical protein NCCP2145_23720 [Pseudarthrobacter sp. NCCP-2145]